MLLVLVCMLGYVEMVSTFISHHRPLLARQIQSSGLPRHYQMRYFSIILLFPCLSSMMPSNANIVRKLAML